MLLLLTVPTGTFLCFNKAKILKESRVESRNKSNNIDQLSSTVVLPGNIDDAIIKAYKSEDKTFCYTIVLENSETLVTSLLYTPIDLFEELQEETSYNAIIQLLENESNINEKEIDEALLAMENFNTQFFQEIENITIQEKAKAHCDKIQNILKNFNKCTDEAFLNALIEEYINYSHNFSSEDKEIYNKSILGTSYDNQSANNIEKTIKKVLTNLSTYPILINPILIEDGMKTLKKLNITMATLIEQAKEKIKEAHENGTIEDVPFLKKINGETINACKLFANTIGKKIARAMFKIHFGNSFTEYMIKKSTEVDGMIIQKIKSLNIDLKEAQTVQLDNNTTCTIEPTYNHLLEKKLLTITCKTKLK